MKKPLFLSCTAALLFVLSAHFPLHAEPAPQPSADEPKKMMTVRETSEFILQKVHAHTDAFEQLYICVKERTAISKAEADAIYAPERLKECAPQLERLKQANFPSNMLDTMLFDNDQERRLHAEGYRLMSKIHPLIVNYFNYFISQDENDMVWKSMLAMKNIILWSRKNGKKYMDGIKEIDRLLDKYVSARGSGVLKNGGELDASKDSELRRICRRLDDYFSYDVERSLFSPHRKGAFLYDLDGHSVKFASNIDSCRRSVDNARRQVDNFHSRLKAAGLETLTGYQKLPTFFNYLWQYPARIDELSFRLDEAYGIAGNVLDSLKSSKGTDASVSAALMNMSLLSTETNVLKNFVNSEASYKKAIKDALRAHLVNTRDKNGKKIVHSIGSKPLL